MLTGWFGLNLVLNAAKDESEFADSETSKAPVLLLGGGLTLLSAISAGVGFSRVTACREQVDAKTTIPDGTNVDEGILFASR